MAGNWLLGLDHKVAGLVPPAARDLINQERGQRHDDRTVFPINASVGWLDHYSHDSAVNGDYRLPRMELEVT